MRFFGNDPDKENINQEKVEEDFTTRLEANTTLGKKQQVRYPFQFEYGSQESLKQQDSSTPDASLPTTAVRRFGSCFE